MTRASPSVGGLWRSWPILVVDRADRLEGGFLEPGNLFADGRIVLELEAHPFRVDEAGVALGEIVPDGGVRLGLGCQVQPTSGHAEVPHDEVSLGHSRRRSRRFWTESPASGRASASGSSATRPCGPWIRSEKPGSGQSDCGLFLVCWDPPKAGQTKGPQSATPRPRMGRATLAQPTHPGESTVEFDIQNGQSPPPKSQFLPFFRFVCQESQFHGGVSIGSLGAIGIVGHLGRTLCGWCA